MHDRIMRSRNSSTGTKAKIYFQGSLSELQDLILLTTVYGEWDEKPNGVWRYRCDDRAALNWSSTRKTVWFEGPQPERDRLKRVVERALKQRGRRS